MATLQGSSSFMPSGGGTKRDGAHRLAQYVLACTALACRHSPSMAVRALPVTKFAHRFVSVFFATARLARASHHDSQLAAVLVSRRRGLADLRRSTMGTWSVPRGRTNANEEKALPVLGSTSVGRPE